jgi:hypothetical protein
MIMYFGSKISENMVKTPEGYLICRNVPIGRIGWMDYYGEELGIEEKRGIVIKVFRSPEELFSKQTMASFEGKSVTNNHPAHNLNLETVGMLERGHVENVRQDGDFLVGDLYIKDAGLISQIENGKREVSSGYDCSWIPIGGDRFEQKGIVGNHVAVVQNGRAGSRVAIQDSQPNIVEGGKERMKVTQKILAAIGFKAFVMDAKPEEIAEAMDAMSVKDAEPSCSNPDCKDPNCKDPHCKGEVKDAGTEKILAALDALTVRMQKFEDSATVKEEEPGADEEFTSLEKEVGDADPEDLEVQDESEVIEEEAKDVDPDEVKDSASVMAKFIQDMKPIIMAIPDKVARDAAAKQFAKSVRDSRNVAGPNAYGLIVNTIASNRRNTMDAQKSRQISQQDATAKMVANFNKLNAQADKGGI